ncbi:unnamed protein product [Linum tenue]|uniref:Dynein light chain n=2 Tax=Linum tenue TaxID=586396 RepID=A0AAV0HYP8_9ROSI|nr:unnamed protein product [Linum tenue]
MATQEKQRRKGFFRFYKFGSWSSNTLAKKQQQAADHQEPVVMAAAPPSIRAVLNSPLSIRAGGGGCSYEVEETVLRTCQESVIPVAARRGFDGGGAVVERGRKSVSHVENNLGSVAEFLQVKVLVTDMPGFMQVHAFRCARRTFDSLEKFSSKHMAYNLKKGLTCIIMLGMWLQEFDKVYGPAWHCIVGSSFGSFVTHSTSCFLYFSMEKLYILVFKTKVQIQKAAD